MRVNIPSMKLKDLVERIGERERNLVEGIGGTIRG
jgi:hypothetical protein